MENSNDLGLTDIYSVAILVYQGYQPELIKVSGRVVFIFPRLEAVQELLSDFNMGKVDVNAFTFSNTIRRLRAQLYGLKHSIGIEE